MVHGHTGLFQRQLDRLKDLSGLFLRIVWSFADGWIDTEMAADVKNIPKLQAGTRGEVGNAFGRHRGRLVHKGDYGREQHKGRKKWNDQQTVQFAVSY